MPLFIDLKSSLPLFLDSQEVRLLFEYGRIMSDHIGLQKLSEKPPWRSAVFR